MKRFIALFLSVLMLVTLACGCGSEEPLSLTQNPDDASPSGASQPLSADVLAGNWTFHMDAIAYTKLNSGGSNFAGMEQLLEELQLPKEEIDVTFTADGKLIFDVPSITTCMENMFNVMRDLLKDKERWISLMMKAQNKTREQLEAEAAEQGTTLDAKLETTATLFNLSIDKMLTQLPEELEKSKESNYVLENGKLYTWSNTSARDENKYMKLHYDGTKITVLEMNGDEVPAGTITFTRR
ncbi:MAG: hypothetical protein E7527_05155 [Ruminococcaceae bacterium]|nr:hypothetical protein [Oscillospiraceae bacterium]